MDNHEDAPEDQPRRTKPAPKGVPSNSVYERVGDEIKMAAHDGVQRGLNSQDIVKEIAARHGVHLSVGEVRLLLAARREAE